MMLFEKILKKNENLGTKPSDIVKIFFNCEPEIIQKDVILAPSWQPDIFVDHVEAINAISEGVFKVWNISINKKNITYIRTGRGAPIFMESVLALGCTVCKNITFIGHAGGLDKNMKIGDIIVPEYTICGDGACRFLTNGKLFENDCFGEKIYPNKDSYDYIVLKTKEISKQNNINWHIGKNFSTETVIAEVIHLDEIIKMGCNCIEMETAALFKSAEICNINAGAIFIVSDNNTVKKSLLSGRSKEEMDYKEYVRKNILPKIVLECFS